MTATRRSGWAAVYHVVERIPRGRVSTYGEIAARAGMPGAARQVGWALHALDASDDVPWHRVLNARGEISRRGESTLGDLQRALLEAEGVRFDRRGLVDLDRHRWKAHGQTSLSRRTGKA
jgi:methylated-DNA-protein-cysteine methyltransferase-like protein